MEFEELIEYVNSRFPLYNEDVKKQLVETIRWLNVETEQDKVTDDLKCKAAREIIKCCRDSPIPEIKIALLNLVLSEFIKNPLSIDIPDVESALWLVRDLKYGHPQIPPTLPIKPIDRSKMFSKIKRAKMD
ncbi:hypothetical protein [Providencia manganoxydans]|uniref:hypothetical protein n=1 Tax=Providencia manganoxydans TaxID=2923283 RepID=UPI0034E443D3